MRIIGRTLCLLTLLRSAGCGCGLPPTTPVYSSFGGPEGTVADYCDDAVVVGMYPAQNPYRRPEGLHIEDFHSPTGSRGRVFLHYPKGQIEMVLVAECAGKVGPGMLYEWNCVQHDKVVQTMRVRIVPGPPVQVFVNDRPVKVTTGTPASQSSP